MSKDEVDSLEDDLRYRLDQPDGTWWELGWDQRLRTYYAQEHSPEPFDPFTVDQPTTWFGTQASEVPSTAHLVEQLDIDVPDDVLTKLERDAAAVPDVLDPQTQADPPVHGRTTLPAAHVVDTLHRLQRDPYLAAEDTHTFAMDLGLEPELARDLLDGTIGELEVEQIAHV